MRITPAVDIPESELSFRYSRSSGPGGQNVNKVATKVTLLFDIGESGSLRSDQKALVTERLANRISRDGVLRVTSQRHRTRSANQREAVRRFAVLIAGALHEDPERRRTRVPAAERRRRIESKKRRSQTKKLRARPTED